MTFDAMVKDLIKQGLLTEKRELTPKGHEYVEQVKKKFDKNTAPFSYDKEGEEDDTTTRKSDRVC
jgi:DNA-binding PadR family transcriptional regulator